MAWGDDKLKQGSRADTPSNRQSIDGAKKTLKGQLRWALDFIQPDEIISLTSQITIEKLNQKGFQSVQKRHHFLKKLEQFHQQQLKAVSKEIERTEKHLPEEQQKIQDNDWRSIFR